MILGGSRRGAGGSVGSRGRLWLLVGGVGCTSAIIGDEGLLDEPRPNGKAPLEALDGVEISWSLADEMETFREGLGGTRDNFGGTSLEARRGVNECERVCVCDGGCCAGDRLWGADPEEDKILRFGGEEERF
jgi:hypothetical protein